MSFSLLAAFGWLSILSPGAYAEDPSENVPAEEGTAPDGDGAGQKEAEPADSGVYVTVSFSAEVAEWRLKGPDGRYYTTGLLAPGSYVLGVRFGDADAWAAFPVPLGEGLEVRVDCLVDTEACRVRSRPRS